jgi:hypothetical protein
MLNAHKIAAPSSIHLKSELIMKFTIVIHPIEASPALAAATAAPRWCERKDVNASAIVSMPVADT